jgi:DNA-directed RNA polymerase subunit RPC12/RpoP
VDESEPSAAPEPELDRGTDRRATDPAATEITLVCSNCWRVSRPPSHGANEVARCTRCGARLRARPPYPQATPSS